MAIINKITESDLKGICVIEVSGESCANCLTLLPILDRLVSQRDDCKLLHIEASEDTMELIQKYEVRQVPTILITLDGVVKERVVGFQPEEILELWLDAKINALKK
jgi:thioredoxin 1